MGPLASLAGGANSPRVSSAKRPVARVLDYSDIDVHAPPSLGKFADVDAAPTAADPSAAPPPIALQASLEAAPGGMSEADVLARIEAVRRQGQLEVERVALAAEKEAAAQRRTIARLTQRSAQLAEGNQLLCSLLKRVHTEGKLAIPFLAVEDELCNACSHESEEAAYWEQMRHIKTFYEAHARGLSEHLDERLREAAEALVGVALKLEALEAAAPSTAPAPAGGSPGRPVTAAGPSAPSLAAQQPLASAAEAKGTGSAPKRGAVLEATERLAAHAERPHTAAAHGSERGAGGGLGFDVQELHRMKQRFEEIMKKHDHVKESVHAASAPAQPAESRPAPAEREAAVARGAPPAAAAAGGSAAAAAQLRANLRPVPAAAHGYAQQAAAAAPWLPAAASSALPPAHGAAGHAAPPAGSGRPPMAHSSTMPLLDKNANLDAHCDRHAAWLQPSLLEAALVRQQACDPDEVFYPLTRQLTCDLAEVFGKADLSKRSRRGGSGEWVLSPSVQHKLNSTQPPNYGPPQYAHASQPPPAHAGARSLHPPAHAHAQPAPAPARAHEPVPPAAASAAAAAAPPPSSGRAMLVALEGPYVGLGTPAPFKLPPAGGTLLIGRSSACDVVLNLDDQISRRHMRIECRGGKYLAFDDGSTYGTTINEWLLGNKENQVLKDGDSILIGASRFRFQMCA